MSPVFRAVSLAPFPLEGLFISIQLFCKFLLPHPPTTIGSFDFRVVIPLFVLWDLIIIGCNVAIEKYCIIVSIGV